MRFLRCAWRRRVVGLFVLLLAGVAAAPAAETFAGLSEKWRHYKSPHFELYSARDDDASRALLRDMELLHVVFAETFKLPRRRPVPVTIFYFSRSRDFRAYLSDDLKNGEFAGFYQSHPDRAMIVVSPTDTAEGARSLIFHEYIHHLVRTAGDNPPAWFSEGVAELYSTIVVGRDKLTFGHPVVGRVLQLQMEKLLPMETLFAVDYTSSVYRSGRHTGLFYSQSWALLHYLYFGESGLPQSGIDQFLHFAGSAQAAKASPEAWREKLRTTTGLEYAELSRRLERYVRVGTYRTGTLPLPAVAPASAYAARPAEKTEMTTRLAELALRTTQSAAAKLVLFEFLRDPTQTIRVNEVLGGDALLRGEEAEARERWENALAAGSDNPAVLHEFALMESRRWFRQFDYFFRLPPERAGLLRKLLVRSIEAVPEQYDAYQELAWVEAFAVTPDFANLNLVQKRFDRLADKRRTLLALAVLRLRVDDPKTAEQMLDLLAQSKNDPWIAHAVAVLRRLMAGQSETPATGRAR